MDNHTSNYNIWELYRIGRQGFPSVYLIEIILIKDEGMLLKVVI